MTLLALQGVSRALGQRELLRGVDLVLNEGERTGLVGANGAGKSTLLRILAGVEAPDEGTRTARRALRLGYLEQDVQLDGALGVRAAVRAGLVGRDEVLRQLERVHEELAAAADAALERLLARQARLEQELERLGGHDVEHRIDSTLQALGLTDLEVTCAALSGGERRRVALARLLLSDPELLLLDEPTNHLDAFAIDWLEDWFLETRVPLLLVTHDRYFLDRICDRIVELDRGRLYPSAGGYAEYLEARAARLVAERNAEGVRLALLRRETAWMRRGPPARTTKAKARIRRYEDLVDGEPEAVAGELEFEIPPGPRLGTRVVELVGATKRYGGRVIVPPLDLELGPGERLGIVGPNGAGKTTLVNLILGELALDGGTRAIGETVRFASIDQMRSRVDPEATVMAELAGKSDVVAVGGRAVRAEAYLDRWGFSPTQQRSLVGALSGGERNRLQLAKLLCAGGNVLVLDEPTNDLDLTTLRALEEALLAFVGSAIVVSHDRWFLDRVASQIVCLDGHGGARRHFGDVSTLLANLRREREARTAEARTAERAASARSALADAPERKRALAPWEQRELGEVEREIGALEAELVQLDARLSDPALYAGPAAERERVIGARAARAAALQALYARWEGLEARR